MSTLKVGTIQDTSGNNSSTPSEVAQGRAKAWVNFNGTGTVAIREDFNVSSITDNATGQYTVTFTNAMADALYCGPSSVQSSGDKFATIVSLTASNFVVEIFNADQGINQDGSPHQVIFGDLA